MWGRTTGDGSGAGRFEIANSANPNPALDVRTTGTGLAGKFTGGDVQVLGNLYAQTGTVLNRATPIAWGTFTSALSPTFLTSSGNVTVTWTGTCFRIFVGGEGDPDTWTVIADAVYDTNDPSAITGEYIVRTASPEAVAGQPGNGVFKLAGRCIAGCEEFQTTHYYSFVVYKGN